MNDAQLRAAMKRGGITDPALTLKAARAVGLPLQYACTVLELETSGGRNVFGSDSGYHGPFKGMPVTRGRYATYRNYAQQTGEHNGVGYTQLTSDFLQVRADKLGGCWSPEPNMRVGFSFLRGLIAAAGSAQLGFTHYNGAASYGRRAMERAAAWQRLLGDAGGGDGGTTQPHGPYASDFVASCIRAVHGTGGTTAGLVYPGPVRVAVGNRPYQEGTTHARDFNVRGGTDNWESEAAYDLYFPYGTPLYAVEAGTIGPQFGPLSTTEPRLAGIRLHLVTADNEFYYAHLSETAPGIRPGMRVQRGALLGRSGRANGVNHLHIGAKNVGPLKRLIESGAAMGTPPRDAAALVQVAAAGLGLQLPRSAAEQLQACQKARTSVAAASAVGLQGALLFRAGPSGSHIAVSLGNGTTLETTRAGHVGVAAGARTRAWTSAALVPGLQYTSHTTMNGPPFPGRLLLQPPAMHGSDVAKWQAQMRARGWRIAANGVYDAQSATVCAAFQREKGLGVDGIVGADTWAAAWSAAIT